MNKTKDNSLSFAITPRLESLSKIAFHRDREGLERFVLIDKLVDPETPASIALHNITGTTLGSDGIKAYAKLHTHNTDEINVILPAEGSHLHYRMIVGDLEEIVHGPATILIKSGTPHLAEVVSGKGQFFCIKLYD